MKKLLVILAILTGTIAVNAQNPGTAFLQKLALTNKRSGNVCTCNTNRVLLKSKANADWFQKMTTLTADTNKNKLSPDITFKASPYTNGSNITLDQLLNTTASANPDHMPVAKPANTDSRMPIVQTDKTAYTMPIVGKTQPRVYYPTVSPKKNVNGVEVRP